jgi:hypothetical protein
MLIKTEDEDENDDEEDDQTGFSGALAKHGCGFIETAINDDKEKMAACCVIPGSVRRR